MENKNSQTPLADLKQEDEQQPRRARYDQPPQNLSSSQAASTVAGSSRFDSGASVTDGGSLYSYRSDRDLSQFVQEVGGRYYHTQGSSGYFLPTDDSEWNRLDKQHTCFVIGLGGLYPSRDEVLGILRPEKDIRKRILDVGCGTGTWALEMAHEFPEADVIGVDLAPTPVEASKLPSNCHFEIDDVSLGLDHYAGSFHLIQARCVAGGIADYRKLMNDIEKCLVPGGMAIFIDVDHVYQEDRVTTIPPASDENPHGSWWQRAIYDARQALKAKGVDFAGSEEALDAGLWQHPLLDPETCRAASLFLPVGPWPTVQDIFLSHLVRFIGSLMRQDFINLDKAFQSLFLKMGTPAEEVNRRSRMVETELLNMKFNMFHRMRVAWGRRRLTTGQPNTTIVTPSHEPTYSSPPVWPFLDVYTTEQECLVARDERAARLLGHAG